MDNIKCHLTGGIFFAILLEGLKPRSQIKTDQLSGSTDRLGETYVMTDFIYVFSGEKSTIKPNSLNSYVSEYKACIKNDSKYIPFASPTAIKAFNNELAKNPSAIVNRMEQFIVTYLSETKYEQLVKYLLDLIINDEGIDASTAFYVTATKKIEKSALANVSYIELPYFLLSVWHYIITYRTDNTKGQPTFLSLFYKECKNCVWKLNSDTHLGESILQSIDVVLPNKIKSDQNDRAQHVKDDSTVDAEQVEPIVIEEKEAEPSQSLQIINKSTIIHQNGHNNINIEHLESLNL